MKFSTNLWHHQTVGHHWDRLRHGGITSTQTAWLRICRYNSEKNKWLVPCQKHDLVWDYLIRENVPILLEALKLGSLIKDKTSLPVFSND